MATTIEELVSEMQAKAERLRIRINEDAHHLTDIQDVQGIADLVDLEREVLRLLSSVIELQQLMISIASCTNRVQTSSP